MSKKGKEIARLTEEIKDLETEYDALYRDYLHRINETIQQSRPSLFRRIKDHEPQYAADLAFDFWPLSDWFRFSVMRYRPGQYFQVCIGPIRFEFYAA